MPIGIIAAVDDLLQTNRVLTVDGVFYNEVRPDRSTTQPRSHGHPHQAGYHPQ